MSRRRPQSGLFFMPGEMLQERASKHILRYNMYKTMERMIPMSLDNQAFPPASIREDGQYSIDLTGPGSHILVIRRGVGSLSIGPPELGNKADLHVAPDEPIHWSVFDPFATPAGSPWPRHLTYTGNDSGFLEWAQKRPIEQMNWRPLLSADVELDASLSRMH